MSLQCEEQRREGPTARSVSRSAWQPQPVGVAGGGLEPVVPPVVVTWMPPSPQSAQPASWPGRRQVPLTQCSPTGQALSLWQPGTQTSPE